MTKRQWMRLTWFDPDNGTVSDAGVYPQDYAFTTMIPYLKCKGYHFVISPIDPPKALK